MLKKNKKGMSLEDLYPAVLTIMLVFIIVGIAVLVLDKFASSSGVSTTAETALNSGRDAIATFNTDWGAIIVLIVAAAVIIGLIVGAFMWYKGRR